jgi:hypothetical protein
MSYLPLSPPPSNHMSAQISNSNLRNQHPPTHPPTHSLTHSFPLSLSLSTRENKDELVERERKEKRRRSRKYLAPPSQDEGGDLHHHLHETHLSFLEFISQP